MNVKDCPHCGKELPEELQFCPYCMHKLIKEKTIEIPRNRKYYNKITFTIVIIIILLTFASYFLINGFNNDNIVSKSQSNLSKEKYNVESFKENNDYKPYIGLWQSENVSSEGGTQLEVITVKNNIVRFNLMLTSTAPQNRIARIDNATGEIQDNIVTFTFDDDSWGNGGTGRLNLSSNEIYVETNITNPNREANWSLSTKAYLKKQITSYIDLDGYIGTNFNDIRDALGQDSGTTTDENTGYEEHYYGQFVVTVNPKTMLIMGYSVDYLKTMYSSKYSFRSIDANSTYEDVIAAFGQPILNTLQESGEIGYGIQNGFIKFYINKSMLVTGFYCFSEFST